MLRHFDLCAFTRTPSSLTVRVGLARLQHTLQITYDIQDPDETLIWPEASQQPAYREGLWQHTCCEIFVGHADHTRYIEGNFSPSGDWALMAFRNYRERDTSWQHQTKPQTGVTQAHCTHTLVSVTVPITELVKYVGEPKRWHVGLTFVAETADGPIYYALQHSGERADFHRRQDWLAVGV